MRCSRGVISGREESAHPPIACAARTARGAGSTGRCAATRAARRASELIVIIARDVTARVEAEQRLRESERRYRELVENAPLGIFVVQDDRIVFANAAAAALHGSAEPGRALRHRPVRLVERSATCARSVDSVARSSRAATARRHLHAAPRRRRRPRAASLGRRHRDLLRGRARVPVHRLRRDRARAVAPGPGAPLAPAPGGAQAREPRRARGRHRARLQQSARGDPVERRYARSSDATRRGPRRRARRRRGGHRERRAAREAAARVCGAPLARGAHGRALGAGRYRSPTCSPRRCRAASSSSSTSRASRSRCTPTSCSSSRCS